MESSKKQTEDTEVFQSNLIT